MTPPIMLKIFSVFEFSLNPKQAGGGPCSYLCPSTLIFDTITMKCDF